MLLLLLFFFYWSGLPCPLPRDLSDPGIEPTSLMSPILGGRFFTNSATWEAPGLCIIKITFFLNKAAGVLQHFFFLHSPPQLFILYWLVNNVVIVSGEQWRDSAMHIHVSILPQTPLPSRLPHNIELSSMCYSVGPCWLSILNIAVCTCPNQTP